MCAGTVYYSVEKFSPNPSHSLVTEFYQNRVNVKEDLELTPYYIRYVHVVPDKTVNEFQMIDLV